MSGKYGGGGNKCVVCEKTCYDAEGVSFEKKIYHAKPCFRCNGSPDAECKKELTTSNAALYEDKLYCKQCFQKNNFAQKQKATNWAPKTEGGSETASKFGGGGTSCMVCSKTVYPAETVSFEKQPFHLECFRCTYERVSPETEQKTVCNKKIEGASGAAMFENKIYCLKCFGEGGFRQKQIAQHKVASPGGGDDAPKTQSRFGGGGNSCAVCSKTVYPAETVAFEKKAYHPDCFKCTVATCGKKMAASDGNIFEDLLYCSKCFKEGGFKQKQNQTVRNFTPSAGSDTASKFGGSGIKCYVCTKTVYQAENVSFEKKSFHPECFKCKHCSKKLASASDAEGKRNPNETDFDVDVYCKKCWKELGLHMAQVSSPKAGGGD